MNKKEINIENAADYLLVFFIIATIISGACSIPLILRILLAILNLALAGFYISNGYLILLGKKPGGRWKTNLFSNLLLVITCVFLALFLMIKRAEIRTALNILTGINMIFAIYSLIVPMNREISVKHFIVSFVMAGFGVFA